MLDFFLNPIKSFIEWLIKMAMVAAAVLILFYVLGFLQEQDVIAAGSDTEVAIPPSSTPVVEREAVSMPQGLRRTFVEAALKQEGVTMSYDATYRTIAYPWGDVPQNTGVCTDVVIRAFRAVGMDLQMNIHNDMNEAFAAYPKLWKSRAPDSNIDHRRVPNVMTYFERRGKALPISKSTQDYQVGDIITWKLADTQLHHGKFHIGIISNIKGKDGKMQVIHNAGEGVVVQDVLFNWEMIGHYRYF